MILRRIASALRRQDWAAVMIELTLVVTGVLIALAASDLYTQRIERRSELIMLDQLRAGLIADAETLQQASQRRQRIEAAAVNLLKHLRGHEPYQAWLDNDFGALYGLGTFILERGGYESIKSKDLDLISDPALRRRVVVLFEDLYPTLEYINQFKRSTILDLMRPVYLERFVDLRFNESATPLDYASLVGDIRFINLIDYRLAVIRQGDMQILSGARAHMLELIDLIDAELGGKAEAVAGGAEA